MVDSGTVSPDSNPIVGWATKQPPADGDNQIAVFIFGSVHPGTWNMTMCAGSVQGIAYYINERVHVFRGSRDDGHDRTRICDLMHFKQLENATQSLYCWKCGNRANEPFRWERLDVPYELIRCVHLSQLYGITSFAPCFLPLDTPKGRF